uniref:Uncharacterized protein n=1 Tax=Arundo donax TaxID=35708 RepID=A0A0A9EHK2_ARUDO
MFWRLSDQEQLKSQKMVLALSGFYFYGKIPSC